MLQKTKSIALWPDATSMIPHLQKRRKSEWFVTIQRKAAWGQRDTKRNIANTAHSTKSQRMKSRWLLRLTGLERLTKVSDSQPSDISESRTALSSTPSFPRGTTITTLTLGGALRMAMLLEVRGAWMESEDEGDMVCWWWRDTGFVLSHPIYHIVARPSVAHHPW